MVGTICLGPGPVDAPQRQPHRGICVSRTEDRTAVSRVWAPAGAGQVGRSRSPASKRPGRHCACTGRRQVGCPVARQAMSGWKVAVLLLLVILPGGSLVLLLWALYR